MHLALLVGLVGASGWILTRPPAPPAPPAATEPATQPVTQPVTEPTTQPVAKSAFALAKRVDIDRAVRGLSVWVDNAYRRATSPAAQLLGLEGIGKRRALREGAPPVPLLLAWSQSRPLEPLGPGGAPELHPENALALLLASGWTLKDSFATADGELPLSDIVAAVWKAGDPATDAALGRRLDFAAVAALSGFEIERSELERLTSQGLAVLERAYREVSRSRGQGTLQLEEVERLAALKRRGEGLFGLPQEGLQLTKAAFRGVMYLRTPELRERGSRVLSGLSYRHSVDRALLTRALAQPGAQAHALRVAAAELDGRKLQVLYAAHTALRTADQSQMLGGLVRVSRETAQDLLLSLTELQRDGGLRKALQQVGGVSSVHLAELRAAEHALKGLRVARLVTPEVVNPHARKPRVAGHRPSGKHSIANPSSNHPSATGASEAPGSMRGAPAH